MGWRRQGFLVEALEGERLESFRKQGWMACLILSGLSVGGETADSSAALRFGQDDKFVALVGSSGWLWGTRGGYWPESIKPQLLKGSRRIPSASLRACDFFRFPCNEAEGSAVLLTTHNPQQNQQRRHPESL